MDPLAIRRRAAIAAAVAPVLATALVARAAVGDFDGDTISLTQTRLWDVGGANPGFNWDLDTLPPAASIPTFGANGDGKVDLNGVARTHAGLTFKDWVSYELFDGTLGIGAFGGGAIKVGSSVGDTYGSVYYADGNKLSSGIDFGPATAVNSVLFTGATTGVLRFSGALTGAGSLTLSTVAGASNIRGVYYDLANAGYSGATTITTNTAARVLESGRTGTGPIKLQGGGLDILSDTGSQSVTNTISSVTGTIRADHDYALSPTPAFAPGILHVLSSPGVPMVIDNPTSLGGTNDASATFTANNGYIFGVYAMKLDNAGGVAAVGTRTITVDNGVRTGGYAGSTQLTGPDRLNETVVSVQIGPTGGGTPTFFDLNPVTLTGIPLTKAGTGVLIIDGVNGGSSTGPKGVAAGVLRFNTAASVGAGAVTLLGGPGAVSSALGVGYSTPIPGYLATTGVTPGQSGAFDVDTPAYVAAFAPAIGATALRLGSSGAGTTTGAIAPYTPPAGGPSTYYLGGGGGTLTIGPGPVLGPAAPLTNVEMGTTGKLLPGRVNLTRAVTINAAGGGGSVKIRAGTLQVMPAGLIGSGGAMPGINAGTSLGAYSTTLTVDGSYTGAPVGTPFDGPGQLLLDSTVQAGPGYFFGPGGHFGFAGLLLDGGALGFTPGGATPPFVPIPALPGTYGTTFPSTLYTSAFFPGPAVATNILHFGGEYSTGGAGSGAIKPFFVITNNGATPVALIKSGLDSTLDMTANPGNPYTGGTAILGGEVLVNMPGQLGAGGPGTPVISIADGGLLHVIAGGPPTIAFPHVLRVSNGVSARASRVAVDGGLTADFSGATFEAASAGSVLEKTGAGTLQFLPAFVYPSTAANTWGVKATAGTLIMNQLPGTATPANGSVIFDGGKLVQVGTADPGYIPIPAPTQYHPNYGYAGVQSYAGTGSTLNIDDSAFFRIDGAQTSSLMGTLDVNFGAKAVLKIAGNILGGDTRGTGTINLGTGPVVSTGVVQFTPGGGHLLWPHDGGFTMSINFGTQFSGCPDADFNGNLLFNSIAGSPMAIIDAATVDNTPTATASTWTIAGTGLTSWGAGVTMKSQTEAIPGSGGPFVSGTVNINRSLGAPVSLAAGAVFDIEKGIVNAGGTGDPFTDSTTLAHLSIVNNATFNITAGAKHVASITGVGTTTVSAGAVLNVGSTGPVTQSTFTVNGSADVGNVNVSGTTGVGPSPAFLSASYVRGGSLSVMSGTAQIKDNSFSTGTSIVNTLAIGVGGKVDLRDNGLVIQTATIGTWTGVNYTGVTGTIASGYNGGLQNGSGLLTTMSSAVDPNTLTNLGVSSGVEQGMLPTDTLLFCGHTVMGSDVLVMYTYGGDANLDGAITGDDYFQIDSGFPLGMHGWFNGDFNYDGAIDGDDYFIIDSNFPAQGAPWRGIGSAGPVVGPGLTAVPEPAAAALMLLTPLLLARRRRRFA